MTPPTARARVEAALAAMPDWFRWDDDHDGLPYGVCRWCGIWRQARMRETTPALMRSLMEDENEHDAECPTRVIQDTAAALAEAEAAGYERGLQEHDCDEEKDLLIEDDALIDEARTADDSR